MKIKAVALSTRLMVDGWVGVIYCISCFVNFLFSLLVLNKQCDTPLSVVNLSFKKCK